MLVTWDSLPAVPHPPSPGLLSRRRFALALAGCPLLPATSGTLQRSAPAAASPCDSNPLQQHGGLHLAQRGTEPGSWGPQPRAAAPGSPLQAAPPHRRCRAPAPPLPRSAPPLPRSAPGRLPFSPSPRPSSRPPAPCARESPPLSPGDPARLVCTVLNEVVPFRLFASSP